MKRPTVASLKRVTPENLATLGIERVAALLAEAAEARPELKRRLRMELAAQQGAEHLVVEIDKRLASLASSRSRISWRQRAGFLRDLEALRNQIAVRLAELDPDIALDRQLQFLALALPVQPRLRDRDGELARLFTRAAADVGALVRDVDLERSAARLEAAIAAQPAAWSLHLPQVLNGAPRDLARALLRRLGDRPSLSGPWVEIVRQLADAAGEVDLYRASFPPRALRDPGVAAEVAQRLLAADRLAEAEAVLADVGATHRQDPAWAQAHIDCLERAGRREEAQAARWALFEATLAATPLREYTRRLAGFDDVEAEQRAFGLAAGHRDFQRGLQFLMDWPALAEAAQMIEARPQDVRVSPELAESWAARLRSRRPGAAHLLLRKTAAAAFQRRDFATCDRLTAEADAIEL